MPIKLPQEFTSLENMAGEIASQFKGQAEQEISRIMSLLSILQGLKTSSSSSLSTKNIEAIAQKTMDDLATKGISSNKEELENILASILQSVLQVKSSSQDENIEEVFSKIIEIIGVNFILNKDSIFYMAQIVARRISVLITFEIALLNSLINTLDTLGQGLQSLSDDWDVNHNLISSTAKKQEYATFYAKQTAQAQTQLDKITEAVFEGKLNPLSTEEFRKIVNTIFNDQNIVKFSQGITSADYSFRKILLRAAYIEKIHPILWQHIENWKSLLDNYNKLDLSTKISKVLLSNINNKLEEWKEAFETSQDKAKFANLREYLLFLSSADKSVESVLQASSVIGTIAKEGTIEWGDDGDHDNKTAFFINPWPGEDLNLSWKFAFSSATLDSDNLSVCHHDLQGFNTQFINISPAVVKPPKLGTENKTTIYFTAGLEEGSQYYLKYAAIKNYLNSKILPKTLSLSPEHMSTDYNSIRKLLGDSLWSYISEVNSRNFKVLEYNVRKQDLVTSVTALINDLVEIQDVLLGYSLPQQEEMDEIDDILRDHNLDILHEYFISGNITKFFTSSLSGSNTTMSIISKINSLMVGSK